MSPLEAQKKIPHMIFEKFSEQPGMSFDGSYWVKHKI